MSELPPHDYDAERAMLGSLLCAGDAGDAGLEIIGAVRELVPDEAYLFCPFHRELYSAICKVVDDNACLDSVQIKAVMGERWDVDKLVDIVESVPVATNGPSYAKLVAQAYQRSRLVHTAEALMHEANSGVDINTAISNALTGLSRAEATSSRKTAATGQAILANLLCELQLGTKELQIPTGLPSFDHHIRKLRKGLHILAARPSVGKSALALNIANAAACAGFGTAVFSMEMDHRELGVRLMAHRTGLNASDMLSGNAEWVHAHRDTMASATEAYRDIPLFIEDISDLSLGLLKTKARRYVQVEGCRLLVIDYLGLMRMPKEDNRVLALGVLSRALKVMSGELGVPILCLHQLSRPQKGSESKRPGLTDLRESGHIEQDADAVYLLHRTSSLDSPGPDRVELLIEKQRGGGRGVIRLEFDGPTTTFTESLGCDPWEGL